MNLYNCAQTLAEVLDSLLPQTYQEFKGITYDDSYTDNTIKSLNIMLKDILKSSYSLKTSII